MVDLEYRLGILGIEFKQQTAIQSNQRILNIENIKCTHLLHPMRILTITIFSVMNEVILVILKLIQTWKS